MPGRKSLSYLQTKSTSPPSTQRKGYLHSFPTFVYLLVLCIPCPDKKCKLFSMVWEVFTISPTFPSQSQAPLLLYMKWMCSSLAKCTMGFLILSKIHSFIDSLYALGHNLTEMTPFPVTISSSSHLGKSFLFYTHSALLILENHFSFIHTQLFSPLVGSCGLAPNMREALASTLLVHLPSLPTHTPLRKSKTGCLLNLQTSWCLTPDETFRPSK